MVGFGRRMRTVVQRSSSAREGSSDEGLSRGRAEREALLRRRGILFTLHAVYTDVRSALGICRICVERLVCGVAILSVSVLSIRVSGKAGATGVVCQEEIRGEDGMSPLADVMPDVDRALN